MKLQLTIVCALLSAFCFVAPAEALGHSDYNKHSSEILTAFNSESNSQLFEDDEYEDYSEKDASEAAPSADDFSLQLAKVLKVMDLGTEPISGASAQYVELEILTGAQKGQQVSSQNFIPDNLAYSVVAKQGRKYVVAVDELSGETSITDYYREATVLAVVILFFVLLLVFGGVQGLKAIASLLLTGLSILYVMVPAIKSGCDPILIAILISAFATASTMLLIAGWTKKSLAATIGTTGGVTIAGVIAILVIKLAPLSGLASTEAQILLSNLKFASGTSLNFQGVLAAGILIASLGAAMDVAISIASSAQEIYLTNPNQGKSELFKHSINIGRDIMGTMTNTLILAYTGSSIPLFLLLTSESSLKVLNMEIIATEITAATVGSIGLLCAIPITAVASAFLLNSHARTSTVK